MRNKVKNGREITLRSIVTHDRSPISRTGGGEKGVGVRNRGGHPGDDVSG